MIWKEFFDAVHQCLDPLLHQAVTQKLFEDIIARIVPTKFDGTGSSCNSSENLIFISADEECIVRYAAGYVPLALIRKYEKQCANNSMALSCIECLCNMAIQGEDSSFLDLTSAWISRVNRGGLFELNDIA